MVSLVAQSGVQVDQQVWWVLVGAGDNRLTRVHISPASPTTFTLPHTADLYAILKATETLEKAYARDAVGGDEYEKLCVKLISQFKSTVSALKIDPTEFCRIYTVDCPRAVNRLVHTGVPATTLHAQVDDNGESVRVAECVQFFITLMDSVRLEQRAADDLHPMLSDLMSSVTLIPGVPTEVTSSVERWLIRLNGMKAAEELDEEQGRELLFDLDKSYNGFHRFLKERNEKR